MNTSSTSHRSFSVSPSFSRRGQGVVFAALLSLSMSAVAYAGCSKTENTQMTDTTSYSQPADPPTTATPPSGQQTSTQPDASQAATPAQEMSNPGKHGDTVITASGLEYIDLKKGTGAAPTKGQTITVNYTGKLTNGKTFDSNVDPDFHHVAPFSTKIGVGQVIPAWDEGMLTMKVGGKRRLICPPNLAYGPRGMPPTIPPNSTLIFDVELLKVQ